MSTTPGIQNIQKECRTAMDKAMEGTRREFLNVRSGKASPNMLDGVRVEMYGSSMSMNQVATVVSPEPRLLVVTPFDKGQAKTIEKAIRDAGLGLEPSNQGAFIRVPLPAMNEERRRDLVKVVHKLGEEGKIAVRHARTSARDALKKVSGVSEDELKHAEKDIQKHHDDSIRQLDELIAAKEAEIMAV